MTAHRQAYFALKVIKLKTKVVSITNQSLFCVILQAKYQTIKT